MYSIGVGFTSKCNMGCAFCYSREKRVEFDELPLPIWYRFIERNVDVITAINYGTGECPISDDWYPFIKFVRDYAPKIRQAVTTNGTLATVVEGSSEKMMIFSESIDEVDVSIDFGDKMLHNSSRACENAFDWAIKTLDLCKQLNKKSTIVLMGTELTLLSNNLDSIFHIASGKNAAIRINIYRPANRTYEIRQPELRVISDVFRWISENGKFLLVSDPLFSSIYFDGYGMKDPSGRTSLRILQNGNVYPSTYLLTSELCLGNIIDCSIDATMNSAILQRFDYVSIPNECKGCEWYLTCRGGTLDRRYLIYGTLTERDPYCPHRPENVGMYERLRVKAPISGYESIHGDYLPTIIAEAN
jgi:radical SAM protein with 4Fe4S-binding SPASM domain